MKRQGHLIEKIAAYENLLWAYWKAKRGKNSKPEVLAFGNNLKAELSRWQAGILKGNAAIGKYHFFTIYEPKERQICAAGFAERVLHHAIMNICHANFENFQIFDSYATRQGKGTYAAIERAAYFQKKYTWFMKIDCRKYFDSIDHLALKRQLNKRFKDEKLLHLFYQIIDSYEVTAGKGLPIGNLTSQYFANHYLAHADRYLSENLKARAMVRYMDDLLIWHDDRQELHNIGEKFETYCKHELLLDFKHQYMNKTTEGVAFLGIYLWPDHVTLNNKSKKRLVAGYKKANAHFEKGSINENTYHKKLNSLMVRPMKVKSYQFRNQLIWNTSEREAPSGRQLLQQCPELSSSQSQQQSARQPQQQQRFSVAVFPQLKPDYGS